MIQRIQSVYLLIAAALVFWAGFGTSLLETKLSSESNTATIVFNMNGFGWQVNANISKVMKTKVQAVASKNKFEYHESADTIVLQKKYPVYLTFCVIGLCLIATIFLFKNTKKQLRMAKISLFILILSVLALVLFFLIAPSGIENYCNQVFHTQWQEDSALGFEFYLLCATICFIFLAITGIKKDQKLVQSLDRIR